MNDIFKHYQNFIDFRTFNLKSKSKQSYYSVAKNLREFLIQNKDLQKIECINSIKFIRLFNQYLFNKFSKGHIKRHVETIKAFVKFLVNDEILPFNKINDFDAVLPTEVKDIVSLTSVEIDTINTTIYPNYLTKIKDVFLFQCLTGLAYVDLLQLKKTMLQQFDNKTYIIGSRSKSKVAFTIPLNNEALQILIKYNYNLPIISNQNYNKYLKEIACLSKINKNLTTHVGRKTCGQLLLNFGYSIEAVSRILGHSDIKTTQMYYARSSFELVHKENLKIAI